METLTELRSHIFISCKLICFKLQYFILLRLFVVIEDWKKHNQILMCYGYMSEFRSNGMAIMSMISNKAHIIKKQLKNHYHYTVNTSFIVRDSWNSAFCF